MGVKILFTLKFCAGNKNVNGDILYDHELVRAVGLEPTRGLPPKGF